MMDGLAVVDVPGRTGAVRVTGENPEEIVEWVKNWVPVDPAHPPLVTRTSAGCFVHFGVQGKRVLGAFEDDWVVVDFLTGKVCDCGHDDIDHPQLPASQAPWAADAAYSRPCVRCSCDRWLPC